MTPADPFHERRIAPSILAADYARLGAQLDEVLAAGARLIHVDVMDGHFVPPITVGPLIVDAIRERVHGAGALLDVHLMIESPERQVGEFARAGADGITVHWEATPHVHYALKAVREAGCRAGLALNPATPTDVVSEVVDAVDHLLCMTVNPGWGGQAFIPESPAKVARLRQLLPRGRRARGRRRHRRGHSARVRRRGRHAVRGGLRRARRARSRGGLPRPGGRGRAD